MIAHVAWRDLPLVADNRLYLDYISGIERVASFFTHAPSDFSASLAARCAYPYPRDDVADRLAEYNAQFGASPAVFTNIEALRQPAAFCVTAGQQVGFLGGPMYTAYKIITTIRLAIHLTETLRVTVVPIFWLATEDHDFNEINHAYYPKADGEVGQVKFAWDQQGRPVADLPVSDRVTQAYRDYFEHLPSSPHLAQVREQFAYRGDKDYCTWHARIWSQLFSEYGLVIAEPTTLRPPAGKLFRSALQHRDEIGSRLAGVSQRLNAAGYEPSLSADTAGQQSLCNTSKQPLSTLSVIRPMRLCGHLSPMRCCRPWRACSDRGRSPIRRCCDHCTTCSGFRNPCFFHARAIRSWRGASLTGSAVTR